MEERGNFVKCKEKNKACVETWDQGEHGMIGKVKKKTCAMKMMEIREG